MTPSRRLPGLLKELVGPRADDVGALLSRFDAAHPHHEPHYYLSLLGTADAHRGRGLGMALLKENLARIDAERMPAYLEFEQSRQQSPLRVGWVCDGRVVSGAR